LGCTTFKTALARSVIGYMGKINAEHRAAVEPLDEGAPGVDVERGAHGRL
jgi:hypothetical protein